MTTANDIITRSLRDLSIIGQGEVADADQAADALVSLNDMVSAWANESALIYQVATDVVTLTGGKKDYTIGSGAYDINSPRPVKVLQAFVRMNGIDYPLEIISRELYQSIILKDLQTQLPTILYYDTGYPSSTIRLWCSPNQANTLHIDSLKPFTAFSSLTDVVSLPPGYERALRLNLDVELMPQYQVSNDKIDKMALEAKAGIKRANHFPESLSFDSAIPTGHNGRYNIYADTV